MKEDLPASGDWWKLVDGDACPPAREKGSVKSEEMYFLHHERNRAIPYLSFFLYLPVKLKIF